MLTVLTNSIIFFKDSNIVVVPDIIQSTINKQAVNKKDASTTTTTTVQNGDYPCQPGTPIVLEGIIWQETNRGNSII